MADKNQPNDTLRGVLIGCGFFSDNHMHAWTADPSVTITGVCDLDKARARDTAERFDVEKFYTDAEAMLNEQRPDFVDVATTVGSHRHLVNLASKHAKTIICQKPFAETMADAANMVETCRAAGVHLLVHENFRWQRAFTVIKTMIETGELGDLNFAHFSFRHGYDNYVNQPYLAEIERFTIMDVGLHLFDLARHCMGEVKTLSCATQRLNPIVRGEDAFTAMLTHQNGAVSICDCSFFSKVHPDPFPQTIAQIEGSNATLVLGKDYQLTLHTPDGSRPIDAAPPIPAWGQAPWHGVQDSVIRFQAHAAAVARGIAQPQPSGADNIKTLALALAAYEAAAENTTISMDTWQEQS